MITNQAQKLVKKISPHSKMRPVLIIGHDIDASVEKEAGANIRVEFLVSESAIFDFLALCGN